jgi:hypothetical protein
MSSAQKILVEKFHWQGTDLWRLTDKRDCMISFLLEQQKIEKLTLLAWFKNKYSYEPHW